MNQSIFQVTGITTWKNKKLTLKLMILAVYP